METTTDVLFRKRNVILHKRQFQSRILVSIITECFDKKTASVAEDIGFKYNYSGEFCLCYFHSTVLIHKVKEILPIPVFG